MAQDKNAARPWREKYFPLYHPPKAVLLPGLTPGTEESPHDTGLPPFPGSLTLLLGNQGGTRV